MCTIVYISISVLQGFNWVNFSSNETEFIQNSKLKNQNLNSKIGVISANDANKYKIQSCKQIQVIQQWNKFSHWPMNSKNWPKSHRFNPFSVPFLSFVFSDSSDILKPESMTV